MVHEEVLDVSDGQIFVGVFGVVHAVEECLHFRGPPRVLRQAVFEDFSAEHGEFLAEVLCTCGGGGGEEITFIRDHVVLTLNCITSSASAKGAER